MKNKTILCAILTTASLSLLSSCTPPKAENADPENIASPKTEHLKHAAEYPKTKPSAPTGPTGPSTETQATKTVASSAFDKTLELHGISFRIQCPNNSSLNQVTITPKGLEGSNEVISEEADGTITGAEIADLNGDGSPEIYIFINSAGSGAYASLIAYSANQLKSLSAIYLPELVADKKLSAGYMGHDEFAIVENVLARRFPLYQEGDSNAQPTGKMRQIQYQLKAGEASWQLIAGKVSEF
ncbi:MAG: PliI family lysozyme inhibitor of I-type lysozyme [Verrucomicrobiota bacterium]